MEKLIAKLDDKMVKHYDKFKAHDTTLDILEAEYKELFSSEDASEGGLINLERKILSTIKNIEYHTGSYKTYAKAINMIRENNEA